MWFFCSSRRRHTRWPRDWSSDVCSSDLTVGEVAKLGLPDHECRGIAHRIAILESTGSIFRKQAVINEQPRLLLTDMVQGDVLFARLLVIQYRVAVAERASPRVLSAKSDGRALLE